MIFYKSTNYQKEHGLDVRSRCFSRQKCVRLNHVSSNKCKSNLAYEFTIHVQETTKQTGNRTNAVKLALLNCQWLRVTEVKNQNERGIVLRAAGDKMCVYCAKVWREKNNLCVYVHLLIHSLYLVFAVFASAVQLSLSYFYLSSLFAVLAVQSKLLWLLEVRLSTNCVPVSLYLIRSPHRTETIQ